MIELLGASVLLGVLVPLARDQQRIANEDRRQREEARNRPRPGLSSQRAQIRPLKPSSIKLGKKAYLGPKPKRNKV